MELISSSQGEFLQRVTPMMLPDEKELSHMDVYKAQLIFGLFCNEEAIITKEKWEELVMAASLGGSCRHFHDPYQCCTLANFIAACWGWFPLDEAWEKLADRFFTMSTVESINNDMQHLTTSSRITSIRNMSRDELQEELSKTNDPPMICFLKLRLGSKLLGDDMSTELPSDTPREDLEDALSHLSDARRLNPACCEVHFWLAMAEWRLGLASEAKISMRRALMLSRTEGHLWYTLGCMAFTTNDHLLAICAWLDGAALGSYMAAMSYGKHMSSMPGGSGMAAAAFKLAMRLADTPGSEDDAEKLLQDVVAKRPSSARVQPLSTLRTGGSLHPELEYEVKVGISLLF